MNLAVWRWVSLRHLMHDPGRTLLTLCGVALGVAVFVSIRLANHSALGAFSQTVDAVAGKANLQVSGDSLGFDETLFEQVRNVPGVRAAAPVVQLSAQATAGPARVGATPKGEDGAYRESLMVLGLSPLFETPFARFGPTPDQDSTARAAVARFLADPEAAALTTSFAARMGLKVGDPLHLLISGRPVRMTVRELLAQEELQHVMGGNVLLCEITTAQRLFGREGRLDRIDLIVDEERMAEVKAALAARLPAGVRAGDPQGRTRQVENMVRAFGLNLTALSFIALFVSMFLIFNAVSMAVLRRRREIGILRSLGVTRGAVLGQFLAEGLVLGVIGSGVGLALGTLMARAALGSVAETISTLYLAVHARQVQGDPATYAFALVLGVSMSLLSALAPAVEAAQTPPAATVRQGAQLEARRLPIAETATAGFLILGAGAAAAWSAVALRQPLWGFASAFFLLLGFSLLAPAFTLAAERLLTPLVRRLAGMEGLLGARYLREAVARTSVVVAALMVSVGMLVGLTVMVGSFRNTVEVWVGQTIRGDLYVEPQGRGANGSAASLPDDIRERIVSIPGVADADTYRAVSLNYRDRVIPVIGIDFRVQRDRGRMTFIGEPGAAVLDRCLREGGVVISESFAFHFRARPGDELPLDTPSGSRRLRIQGVYYDYTTDAGALMLDHRLYAALWNDHRTESIALYLQPGTDVQQVRAEVLRRVGGEMALHATPNQELRRRIMTVFDQTFRITYALQAIAILVAVLGVITTLTALITQRGREIGVLRAVGALQFQVRKMVLVESGLMGLIGALLGCLCGMALALLLTFVINKQFFGWSIRLSVDPWLFPQAVALMVVTATLAGLVPAGMAARRAPSEAMRAD